jgi:hypothetical protein
MRVQSTAHSEATLPPQAQRKRGQINDRQAKAHSRTEAQAPTQVLRRQGGTRTKASQRPADQRHQSTARGMTAQASRRSSIASPQLAAGISVTHTATAYDAQEHERSKRQYIAKHSHAGSTSPKIASKTGTSMRGRKTGGNSACSGSREQSVSLKSWKGIALRAGDAADGTQVRALELLGKTLGLFVDQAWRPRTRRRETLMRCRAELEARLNRLIG